MAEVARAAWSAQEFFAWQERQQDRYELVDGQPLRRIAGCGNVHNDVVINVVIALGNRLADSPCRLFNGDCSAETKPGQIRRPVIGVECGPRKAEALKAEHPRLVAEVLSPTTRDFDTFAKVEEYKLIEGLRRILLIDPNRPHLTMWARDGDGGWSRTEAEGLDATIDCPEIGAVLPLAEVYRRIDFPTVLRLVPGE